MSAFRLITAYSWRLMRREWRRFVLPFLSLTVTTIVLTLVLILTGSSADLLSNQARQLQGGDIVFESNFPFDGKTVTNAVGVEPELVSNTLSFSATLQSKNDTAPFSIEVVDGTYPIYGELLIAEGIFEGVGDGEVYMDQNGLDKLGIQVGDTISFGDVSLRVSGTVTSKPTSLFGGFSFLPTAFVSQNSFTKSAIDPQLLRIEYSHAIKTKNSNISDETISALEAYEKMNPNISVDIAGQDQRGLQFGLSTVSDFLTIAVLVTAILAAVNVYASILYLVSIERKSLAIMLALGLTKRKLVLILGVALGYVVLLSNAIGLLLTFTIFRTLQTYISQSFLVNLPTPDMLLFSIGSIAVIGVIALMSFLPAAKKSLNLNPKQILIGGESSYITKKKSHKSTIFTTIAILSPLAALAGFLLESFTQGLLIISAIGLLYVVVVVAYSFLLKRVYKARHKTNFFLRTIISQKYADGFFGTISFASLFVALTALSTLVLLQVSLERFLVNDLSTTVPSTYVVDVQPSQKEELLRDFSELELFSNVRARIVSIDSVNIQEELKANNPDVSGELGREFNITSRNNLLTSEEVVEGVWSNGAKGEISVDERFAEQANIKIGSRIRLLIQGFEVEGVVTSLRVTDSRSGLPFFYFVLSPEDIGNFPSVYFGYSYFDAQKQDELGVYLAQNMPNISVIETQSIGPLVLRIVGTLMILVFIVTVPPLVIATLLIAMLVVSSYSARRREGARFRAIGYSKKMVFWQYILETISITIVTAVFSYVLGVLIAGGISATYLKLDNIVFFDRELLVGLGLVVVSIASIGFYLYKSDTIALRELLSYE